MDDRPPRSDVMAVVARDRGAALGAYAYLLTGDLRDAEDLVQRPVPDHRAVAVGVGGCA